jgi:CheY-like chemotaxis protein
MCNQSTRVLVVDDSEFTRSVITQSLKVFFSDQIIVETAENLRQALALDLPGFDLIFADLDLFGGSGLKILYRLRELGHTTPFVVMTGLNAEEVLKRLKPDVGLENFRILLKPFNIIRIRELVIELVALPVLCK